MDAVATPRPLSQPVSRRLAFAALTALALALAYVLGTAPVAHGQDATLQKAQEEYQFAEYDRAIELFSKVAQDPTADPEMRKTAYRYLGRAYIAKNKRQQARQAIKDLVQMEPPLVELDPDVEPPPVMDIYYEVRKELTGYEVQKQDPGLQTLAIMDFTNNSISQREQWEGLRKGLPSMMINFLNTGVDLKVIERERIQWILNEQKLQRQGDVVDQSTAVRTGKLLGANAVVFGSYTIHDDEMILLARVADVETSEILLGEEVKGNPDDFYELIQELSTKVTRAVNVEMEETKMGAKQTKSLDAMMAYSDGLDLMEDGNYRAAYEKFLAAIDYDQDFQKAKLKAQSLKPMLAVSTAAREPSTQDASTQMNR